MARVIDLAGLSGAYGARLLVEGGHDPATREVPILILTAHELTPAEKALLNGHILGVVDKGETARAGLLSWLDRVVSVGSRPSAA